MKKLLVIFASLVPVLAMADHHKDKKSAKIEASKGAYRHVVIFKFKDDATKEQIKKVETEFGKLPEKIETITGYEWGTNVSPENHDQGYTHCFIVSFKDRAGLDVYLPHKAHKEFVEVLKPILDKVMVIDFVAQ
ncbi:MAG: Dabb family protein [Akkermansiaceae bacterium]